MDVIEVATKAVQLYAESHPRPTQVTQAQAAEMLGISRHTVARMVKTGAIRLNGCGLIAIRDVDRLLKPQ